MSSSGFPDPRRHAYRAGLADARLRDLVEAERYVQGEPRQVVAPSLPLRRDPRPDSLLETEALRGETVTTFAESEGWTWVQIDRDLYVGYMPSEGLSASIVEPTHRIAALRTYVFPEPDAKSAPLALLSLNALVTAEADEGKFLTLKDGGYVFARHTLPAGEAVRDAVAVAEKFLGTPYLWGGRTSIGLDCSGLVQLAHRAVGVILPRDADLQWADRRLTPVPPGSIRPGDLVFFGPRRGTITHVGIAIGRRAFVNATTRRRPEVRIDRLGDPYWKKLFRGARRLRGE